MSEISDQISDPTLGRLETHTDAQNKHEEALPPMQPPAPGAIVQPKSKYLLVSCLCFFAAFGGFIFGYDTGTISGYINMTEFLKHFGDLNDQNEYYFSKVRSGLIVSIFSIGACIGGIFFSKSGDMWGRKVGVYIGVTIYVIGVIIQIASINKWYQFMIGRLIGGMGVGTLSVIVPMFQSETAPQQIRGALVSSYQLMITLGIFIGYCVCYRTSTRNDTGAYRIPLALCFAWAAILIIGMTFLPESARYLISKGRIDDATKSMCFINRCPADDPALQETMAHLIAGVEKEEAEGSASWIELFTGRPRVGYRLMVGVVVLALQQFAGANYFFYYGTSIFKAIGMENSFATSMIFGAVNFVSTFFALYIVDRFGRRAVLFYGAIGMFCFFIIYASLGAKALYPNGRENPAVKSVGDGMIAVTCFYIFCFAVSWAPCAFVLVSELYPLRIKSKGMSLGLGANWLANFLLGFFTPFITGAIHFYYGFVFAGCLLFSIFFVWFFVHETKGLSLEDIDVMFESRVTPWQSSNWSPAPRNDYKEDNLSDASV